MTTEWPPVDPGARWTRTPKEPRGWRSAVVAALVLHGVLFAVLFGSRPNEVANLAARTDAIQVEIIVASEPMAAERAEPDPGIETLPPMEAKTANGPVAALESTAHEEAIASTPPATASVPTTAANIPVEAAAAPHSPGSAPQPLGPAPDVKVAAAVGAEASPPNTPTGPTAAPSLATPARRKAPSTERARVSAPAPVASIEASEADVRTPEVAAPVRQRQTAPPVQTAARAEPATPTRIAARVEPPTPTQTLEGLAPVADPAPSPIADPAPAPSAPAQIEEAPPSAPAPTASANVIASPLPASLPTRVERARAAAVASAEVMNGPTSVAIAAGPRRTAIVAGAQAQPRPIARRRRDDADRLIARAPARLVAAVAGSRAASPPAGNPTRARAPAAHEQAQKANSPPALAEAPQRAATTSADTAASTPPVRLTRAGRDAGIQLPQPARPRAAIARPATSPRRPAATTIARSDARAARPLTTPAPSTSAPSINPPTQLAAERLGETAEPQGEVANESVPVSEATVPGAAAQRAPADGRVAAALPAKATAAAPTRVAAASSPASRPQAQAPPPAPIAELARAPEATPGAGTDGRAGRRRPTAVLASVGDRPLSNLPPERADARPFDLGTAVDNILTGAACTRVGVAGIASGSVALTGIASDDAARTALVDAVASLPGAPSVNAADVVALPVPCVMMSFLDELDERSQEVALVSPERVLPGARQFEPWQRLRLEMLTPTFESFLMVDYFAADGSVYHLDSDNWPTSAFPASRPVLFGGRGGIGVPVTLRPPPGREFLLVTASSRPVFAERVLSSASEPYVERLRRGIDTALNAGATVEILAAIIETGSADASSDDSGTSTD